MASIAREIFGGMGALGSGMVLGREGPTVQMGGAVGRMISDIFRVKMKIHAIHCWLRVRQEVLLPHLTRLLLALCL